MPDFDYVCGMASDDAPGETGHDYDHEVHAPEGFCGTGFSDVRRVAKKQLNRSKKPSVECRYCGKQGLTWFQPNIGRYRLKDQEGNEHICQEYFAKHGAIQMTEYEAEKMRMLESDVERYKISAGMWRNHAYKMGGTPLPWDADELLQKAIDAEREACAKLCDEEYAACWNASAMSQAKQAQRCAEAIRARGNK